MKEIVPKDSRYVPFTQQPYSCVPTSIQIVMYRHGIPLIPAEELGYYLGLTVPKEVAGYFWHTRVGKRKPSPMRPIAGYGTRVFEKGYDPNKIFKKLGIPLTMRLISVDTFKDFTAFKKFLSKLSKRDFDMLLCFHHGTLADNPEKDNGHVVVLDKIYPSKGTIRFVDPKRGAKWEVVKMKKMYEAMKAHARTKTGGFWELKKI